MRFFFFVSQGLSNQVLSSHFFAAPIFLSFPFRFALSVFLSFLRLFRYLVRFIAKRHFTAERERFLNKNVLLPAPKIDGLCAPPSVCRNLSQFFCILSQTTQGGAAKVPAELSHKLFSFRFASHGGSQP